MGKVSKSISADTEDTLFGINMILILIMQERDSVHGEIKYSLLPILLTNSYVVYSNLTSLNSLMKVEEIVDREACYYSIGFYFLSWVGYYQMEQYN